MCTYVCVHIYTHAHIYICVYMYMYNMYTYVHICTYMYICMCAMYRICYTVYMCVYTCILAVNKYTLYIATIHSQLCYTHMIRWLPSYVRRTRTYISYRTYRTHACTHIHHAFIIQQAYIRRIAARTSHRRRSRARIINIKQLIIQLYKNRPWHV